MRRLQHGPVGLWRSPLLLLRAQRSYAWAQRRRSNRAGGGSHLRPLGRNRGPWSHTRLGAAPSRRAHLGARFWTFPSARPTRLPHFGPHLNTLHAQKIDYVPIFWIAYGRPQLQHVDRLCALSASASRAGATWPRSRRSSSVFMRGSTVQI